MLVYRSGMREGGRKVFLLGLGIEIYSGIAKAKSARVIFSSALEFWKETSVSDVSETHFKNKNNVQFIGHNIFRNNNNTSPALVIENLPVSFPAATIVIPVDNRRISVVFVYSRCSSHTEQLKVSVNLMLKSKYLIFRRNFNSRYTFWGIRQSTEMGKTY